MPFESKAQMRLFYAAANKKAGAGGISQKTAKKFIADSKGEGAKTLPEKKSKGSTLYDKKV